MKLRDWSVELVPQEEGLTAGLKHIEKAMRNCYRSEDLITEDSYRRMIDLALTSKHHSVLEHFTVYLTVSNDSMQKDSIVAFYTANKYSKLHLEDNWWYITTNYRVIIENYREDDLIFLTEPTRHAKRYTFKVVCSEAIAREFNRSRTLSVSQQSTRYCNYSKGKYNGQITYIIPQWIYDLKGDSEYTGATLVDYLRTQYDEVHYYCRALENAEKSYMDLTKTMKAQYARGVLPLDTATTVFYTAFQEDWDHFIKLRDKANAHPDIQVLAKAIKQQIYG